MEETLTVTRLGITGKLKRTLQSTNPCESMISTVRAINRNVKNWSSGEMAMRWTAAGMLEAETRFRKVEGYRGLARLAIAIERRPHPQPPQPRSSPPPSVCNHQPGPAATRSSTTNGTSSRARRSASTAAVDGQLPLRLANEERRRSQPGSLLDLVQTGQRSVAPLATARRGEATPLRPPFRAGRREIPSDGTDESAQ